ncbi:hypothetical protein NA57DRAFT_51969 [Rhizodiscina lignyota]|uniref:Uncharacterized protein n=1 Tax=Rhizodiscina lignyota TaxID=1504668 RepID=A0A9P4MCF2_9PEZI|nr:hypothetical protein NA57DRAFT_51969 [Rhizodiscina lignyota]
MLRSEAARSGIAAGPDEYAHRAERRTTILLHVIIARREIHATWNVTRSKTIRKHPQHINETIVGAGDMLMNNHVETVVGRMKGNSAIGTGGYDAITEIKDPGQRNTDEEWSCRLGFSYAPSADAARESRLSSNSSSCWRRPRRSVCMHEEGLGAYLSRRLKPGVEFDAWHHRPVEVQSGETSLASRRCRRITVHYSQAVKRDGDDEQVDSELPNRKSAVDDANDGFQWHA